MNEIVKYPVGCKIKWCDEEYEVVGNCNDYIGKVKQGETIIDNFYFNYQGEIAEVISVE